ncbi:MAG: acyl carrier protein [Candidatus Sericytochromatia bacterium]|uniref:Acyl carrier protein n=1 Tax=Candidatus Tanganyikabacteria bacterium TaxID=2961651 RepID=A0A937X794_9BACT|nr:acyl carrier protein [Candidatus Tanganyikabacteria bacterium]
MTTPNITATESRLIELLARMLGRKAADLGLDQHLVKDLGIDSVDLLGLVSGIEEEFDIVFPADGHLISNVKTIRELVALVEEYQAG